MALTRSLSELLEEDRALVGGKALGCARLLELGLRVPAGFVITTEGFRAFLDRSGQANAYEELLGVEGDAVLAERCAARQARLRDAPLPLGLLAEVNKRLGALEGPLAVRSSAVSEDGLRSSFAGVFESRLDVRKDEVESALRACWVSAFSHVALRQQLAHDLDPREGGMAVLVMDMVDADFAGALFTREPSGARPEEAVIAYVRGTGEALMEGGEGGTSVRLDRPSGAPLVGEELGDLPLEVVKRLLAEGKRVEERLGHPQDLEWTLKGGEIAWVQTRPISTIEPLREPPVLWTRELSEERFPQPISPLGWSALLTVLQVNNQTLRRRFGLDAKHPEDIATAKGSYVYSNEAFFKIPGNMRFNPLKQARFFFDYYVQGLSVARWSISALTTPGAFGLRWLLLSRLFRAFVLPHAREIQRSWSHHLESTLVRMDRFAEVEVERLTVRGLWDFRLAMQPVAEHYMEPDLAVYVVKMACSSFLTKLGETLRGGPDPGFLVDLTSGVRNCTLDMNEELQALFASLDPDARALLAAGRDEELLATLCAADDAAGRAYRRFVERNGHNTSNWDMRQPTWGEDPAQILALMRGYARSDRLQGSAAQRAEQSARYEAARARVIGELADAPYMIPVFEEALDTLRAFMAIDEEHHFYCSRLFRSTRRVFRELGLRLSAGGVLEDPEEIYFLTLDEVRRALVKRRPHTRRYLTQARRAAFERSARQRPPERLLNQTPLAARGAEDAQEPDADGTLRGEGASAGEAEGIVRVVTCAAEAAAFQPGEVLVVASPNPVWTPLYAVASAVVASTGSLLSHGLVSAREYHLPAVIKIADVHNRLETGQRVRVNGTRGTVAPA